MIAESHRICPRSSGALFEVRFYPPDRVEVLRGYLRLNGYEFLIRPDSLYYLNQATVFKQLEFASVRTAIMVAENPGPNTAVLFPAINRDFSELSREESLESIGKNWGSRSHYKMVYSWPKRRAINNFRPNGGNLGRGQSGDTQLFPKGL